MEYLAVSCMPELAELTGVNFLISCVASDGRNGQVRAEGGGLLDTSRTGVALLIERVTM